MSLFSKFAKLLVKHNGFLPPQEKSQLYKAASKGGLDRSEIEKLMAMSRAIKKKAKQDIAKNPKARKEAIRKIDLSEGHVPANEIIGPRTSALENKLPSDHSPSVAEGERIGKKVTRKRKAKLRTDKPFIKAAKKGADVGERFLRNKKAQMHLVSLRIPKNKALRKKVMELGGIKAFVNSEAGQRWIAKAAKRIKEK